MKKKKILKIKRIKIKINRKSLALNVQHFRSIWHYYRGNKIVNNVSNKSIKIQQCFYNRYKKKKKILHIVGNIVLVTLLTKCSPPMSHISPSHLALCRSLTTRRTKKDPPKKYRAIKSTPRAGYRCLNITSHHDCDLNDIISKPACWLCATFWSTNSKG